MTSSQQCCWRFKCSATWHCLSDEQFWSGVVSSFSKSSILRRMPVYWTHWHWRWHYDPLKQREFLIQKSLSHHKLLKSSTKLIPSLLFCITSLMVNERELYQKRENITIKNPPPYIQYNVMPNIKTCYSPALDSFHISQSKGLGKDVDKVGSYCIFSYTHMFQDPCGKACIQCVHSEAVSF